jgi:hypothetical protein
MKGKLDKRLLYILAAMSVAVVLRYTVFDSNTRPAATVAPRIDSIPMAEQRLDRLRRIVATVPAKEAMLRDAQAELAKREKGVIHADTAPQAQAHLLDTIHRLEALAGMDARGADQLPEVRALGADYGVVSVAQSFTCGIEQLVNFLAALHGEPEIVASNDIHIIAANDKQKNIRVRLTLSGVVPKSLAPKKKGPGL